MAIQRHSRASKEREGEFCQECHTMKQKGYWMFWQDIMQTAMFACDDCLKKATKV